MSLYVGWLLPKLERRRLLEVIPPAYVRVVAHHVTLEWGVTPDAELPTATSGEVVGIADDQKGVQALVVRIGGVTRRPDGGTYHCTWSLAPGRQPVESNAVIAEYGWQPLPDYVAIMLTPKLMGTVD